jgi:hypothetical protein
MKPLFAILIVIGLVAPARAQFSQQGTKLVGTGASGTNTYQGRSVGLSADGNTAIIGGNNDGPQPVTGWNGAAWIYTRNGAAWTQQGAKLVGSGASGPAQQGQSVALSGDGNTAIIGGPLDGFTGAAWVFTRSGGAWTQQGGKLVGNGAAGNNGLLGMSVAISGDGNTALIGGPGDNGGTGAVWVFTRNASGLWSQQGNKLVGAGGSGFSSQGTAVALSSDGNTALIGGELDAATLGAAWVFTRNSNGLWTQQTKLTGIGVSGALVFQGHSVALSSDGNTAAIGGQFDAGGVGASWVFTRNSNGVWTQQGAKLVGAGGSPAEQGQSVALSGDGNTLVVGGPLDNSGWIWIFKRSAGAWTQQGNRLTGTGEVGPGEFGWSVALSTDGGTALVGGKSDGLGSAAVLGAAWPFGQTHLGVAAPSVATAGVPFNFTVSALDANNAAITTYSGTAHITSSDALAVLPADTTLTAGAKTLSTTLKTSGIQTITAVDTANNAVTGTSSAITVSGGSTAIGPSSVTPAAGSATGQAMSFTFTDPKGFADLGVENILINSSLDGRRACYLAYNQPTNVLYLVGDDGGTLSAGAVLNTAGSRSNSQCTVAWGGAPVLSNGKNLTLVLTLTFTASFSGNKTVFLAAGDQGTGNSGWQPLGVWQVPGGAPVTPTLVVGVIPNRGTGLGPTPYTFNYSDTKGYTDLGVENILINTSIDGRHACYLAFARTINTLYLMNDAGDTLSTGQSMAVAGSVSNSQCTVTWGVGAVSGSGNNLALTLNIGFAASFAGNRTLYLAARDVNEANTTDWQSMGTWTVQ